jgi:hypothetical protein
MPHVPPNVKEGGPMDGAADGSVRWLSYVGRAEAFDINRESARQLTLRKRWGSRSGNEGQARVGEPVWALPDPSSDTSARTSSRTDGRMSFGTEGEASALQLADLEALRVKLVELEAALRVRLAELEGERRRCDELLRRCDELRGERADQRAPAQAQTLPSSSWWRWWRRR